jgi:hypothetical protein
VRPEQWRDGLLVLGGELEVPVGEDVLDQEGVELRYRRLEYPKAEHRELSLVAAVARDVAALAVVDDRVSGVPRLGDINGRVDLPLQFAVVADPVTAKRDMARRLGPTHTPDPRHRRRGGGCPFAYHR